MIKDLLKSITPSLAEQLPYGAINDLADKHNKTRQSIAKMLKGDDGPSEENTEAVLKSALEILRNDSNRQKQLAIQLENILNQKVVEAS